VNRKASDIEYGDDGCDVHPRCLECPLSVCKHDNPRPYLVWRKQQKDKQMEVIIDQATSPTAAAEILGITERTVYRIKARRQRAPSTETARRRQEVFKDIAIGGSLRAIAEKHGLSERTVARYRLKLEQGDYYYGPNV